MSEIYKIVFIGLDFAGKTSILKVLEGSYSSLDQIKPTLGRNRTEWDILGFKIINWDLSGQKQYRDEYLANKEQVLRDTNLLIYVVDAQDASRFEEAGIYFDNVLKALEELKIRCPVLLCIHKMDPDILNEPEIQNNLEKIEDLFSEYSQRHDVEIKVFTTSIFDQKSLIEMFSEGIRQLMPVGILNQILDEFRKETGVVGAILFDLNFFVIGDSFPDVTTRNTCYQTINAFITLMRDFKGIYDDERQINFNLDVMNGINYKFQLNKISELTSPFYLLIMGSPTFNLTQVFSVFHKKYVPKIDKSLHDLITAID